MYLEFRPTGGISPIVECLWRRDGSGLQADDAPIFPDGRVDLVWTSDGSMLVAGPQTRAVERPLAAPFVAIGARFAPGVAPPLLGLPAHELVDQHVPLDSLDTAAAAALVRRLTLFGEAEEGLRRLGDTLAHLIGAGPPEDPEVAGAARLLEAPGVTVERVATEVALSERQLQRRFRETVGYGPKTLQRILRFQRLLHALERGHSEGGGLARIAASLGYADQAHLTRESRELAGLSPVELERLWRQDPPSR